jgi:hypothetical protein
MLKELIEQSVKEILLGNLEEKQSSPMVGNLEEKQSSPMVGKICMIRTYSSGVHFGEVVSKNGQNVVLKSARRVHYWAAACSLSQLAMEGDKKTNHCRISMAVNEIELDQVIEVIPMTKEAIENLSSVVWKK